MLPKFSRKTAACPKSGLSPPGEGAGGWKGVGGGAGGERFWTKLLCAKRCAFGWHRVLPGPGKSFSKKGSGSRPRPPHRPPGRPTDGATLFFLEKSFSKKSSCAHRPLRRVPAAVPLNPGRNAGLDARSFFFEKKFFEKKSWLAPPTPGARPTDRPTPPPNFFGKKFFEKKFWFASPTPTGRPDDRRRDLFWGGESFSKKKFLRAPSDAYGFFLAMQMRLTTR